MCFCLKHIIISLFSTNIYFLKFIRLMLKVNIFCTKHLEHRVDWDLAASLPPPAQLCPLSRKKLKDSTKKSPAGC